MKLRANQEPIDWQKRLSESLAGVERTLLQKRCVCLPDFFVDILLFMGMPVATFLEIFSANLRGEGRNIYAKGGAIVPGGNAFNTARAMAKLSCPTYFIGETDKFGSLIATKVASELSSLDVQLRISNRVNSTTAIEINDERGVTHNIQLSLAEALENWGPDHLTSHNETEIRQADLVYLSNWGVNTSGNDLLEKVIEIANGKVMFDPGNVFAGEKRIDSLLELLQKTDIVSLNFDEFNFLEKNARLLYSNTSLDSLLESTLIFIHGHENVRILDKGEQIDIPTFEIEPIVQTGLGDSFAAGVAVGLLAEISIVEAAMLGSAVAGYYAVSSTHPDLSDISQFLQKEKIRIHRNFLIEDEA